MEQTNLVLFLMLLTVIARVTLLRPSMRDASVRAMNDLIDNCRGGPFPDASSQQSTACYF